MSRKISPTCLVLIFCLLFLYSSNNAQAGLNSWTPIGPAFVGEGGNYRYTCSIAFSANFAENGKIFMGDELGYVYIYNKDSDTWSHIYLGDIPNDFGQQRLSGLPFPRQRQHLGRYQQVLARRRRSLCRPLAIRDFPRFCPGWYSIHGRWSRGSVLYGPGG